MVLRNPKFLTVSALCGAMGVLSGYAIYLTYREMLRDHTQTHFLLTLLITAIISYAIEWIREVIREGRIEPSDHPIFRTMGTFLIVLMFELFILGFHTSSDLSLEALRSAAQQLLGSDAPANWTLVFAAGLWVAVGALLAAWLTRSVNHQPGTPRHRIWIATRNGIVGGLVFAPAVMALYIFGGRCLVALLGVYQGFGAGHAATGYVQSVHDLWHDIWVSQNSLTHGWFSSAFMLCILLPMGLLNLAAQKNMAVFMAVFLALAAFAAGYPALRKAKPLRHPALKFLLAAVWVLCVGYTVLPFADAMFRVARQLADKPTLKTLGEIILLAAVIWAVPGAVLGALTPLLRRVATHTRNWAFVGYGSALLLMVATLWARAWWPLIPALAAAAVGYMFQRGSRLSEYWPFAALCVAAGVCGATSIEQHLTFTQEVVNLHKIDMIRPAPADRPIIADRIKSADQLTPTERARLPQHPIGDLVGIRADDGEYILVALRTLDVETVKRAQQFWQQTAAQSQQLIDSLTEPPPQPVMPLAKDMPPRSSYLDAAAAANRPGAPPAKPPAAATSHKSAPVHTTNDLPGFGLPDMTPPPAPDTPTDATATAQNPPPPAAAPNRQPTTSTQQPRKSADPLDDPDTAAKALELSLSGSVGFWVTVGLLACWSMEENDETEPAPESPAPSN